MPPLLSVDIAPLPLYYLPSPAYPRFHIRYAYAITVRFPGGKEQPCLVPFVGLMNHNGGAPHIVHFSKVDEASKTLRWGGTYECGRCGRCPCREMKMV